MRSMTSDTYWTMASQRWRMAIVNFRVVRRNDDELYMDILQCNGEGTMMSCIWTFCTVIVNMEKEQYRVLQVLPASKLISVVTLVLMMC